MKSALVVSVLLLVVVTTGAFAQGLALSTPRALGMGNTQVGIANDGAAWYQNPAGLGMLNRQPMEGKTWANDVIGSYLSVGLPDDDSESACDTSNSESAWTGTYSGWDCSKKWGAGAGYGNVTDVGSAWGAGVGITFPSFPVALGVNGIEVNPDNDVLDSQTLWNIGAMYEYVQKNCAPIRIGAVVSDVSDETDNGPFLALGASWAVIPNLLIAVDVNDVTDQLDVRWNAGAEYSFGTENEWAVRAGVTEIPDVFGSDSSNNDLTLGLGYGQKNWRIDGAWVDTSGTSTWSAGVGFSF